MELKPAICPICGGDLRLPANEKILKCMYCGKDIIVSEAIQKAVGPNIEKLLVLARSAFSSGNYKEAYDYFTKVIELNPSDYEAWFGKGASAGWLSTLVDFRFPEMVTGFENALKYCPQEKKEEMKLKNANTINMVAVALSKLNFNHMGEYGRFGNERENFYTRCRGVVNAWEIAHSYSPTDKQIIENIMDICMRQIAGIKYKEFNQFGQITQTSRITKQYEQTLRLKINEYASKRSALSPVQLAPPPPPPSPTCPTCGNPLTYIQQYQRWYCYKDQKYA